MCATIINHPYQQRGSLMEDASITNKYIVLVCGNHRPVALLLLNINIEMPHSFKAMFECLLCIFVSFLFFLHEQRWMTRRHAKKMKGKSGSHNTKGRLRFYPYTRKDLPLVVKRFFFSLCSHILPISSLYTYPYTYVCLPRRLTF